MLKFFEPFISHTVVYYKLVDGANQILMAARRDFTSRISEIFGLEHSKQCPSHLGYARHVFDGLQGQSEAGCAFSCALKVLVCLAQVSILSTC